MTTTRRLLSSASNNAAAALAKQQQQPPPMLHKFLHTIDAGKKPPIGAGPGDSLKTSEEPNKSPAATAAAAKGSGGSGKVFGSILQRNFEKEEALMNDIPERQKHWSEEYIFLGNRKIVGPGRDNSIEYFDHPRWPYPAVYFEKNNAAMDELIARAKSGGWNSLSEDEVKKWYRHCFRQTLCETMSPKGFFHRVCTYMIFIAACSMWMPIVMFGFVDKTDFEELDARNILRIEDQLRKQIGLDGGLAADWDYETRTWKR
ncbi:MAG: oxidoreductase activity containing protein [Marteilia pararefringens]